MSNRESHGGVTRDDLDECWCCGGLHDALGALCPTCYDAGCKHFGGECQSDHKPVMPDGGGAEHGARDPHTFLDTIEAPEGVSITLETDVIAKCPVDSGVDRYDVEIHILSEGQSVECQSLQEYLDTFVEVEASQEQVTASIDDALARTLSDAKYRLKVTGEHSGVCTEVRGR